MVEFDEVSTLKLLGMSGYEAKCYLVLLSSFDLTAKEISELAEIPRVKSYESLESLINQGWVTKTHTRPAMYSALPPHRSLNPKSTNLLENLRENLSLLQSIWDNKNIPINQPMQHFTRKDKLRLLTNSLISSAEQKIFLLLNFSLQSEFDQIKQELIKKAEEGLQISVIVHPTLYESELKNTIEELNKIVDVRLAPIPARVLISDSKQVLLSTPPTGSSDLVTIHSMYVRIPGLVEIIEQSIRASMVQMASKLNI